MGPDFGSSVSYKDYEEEESADGEQSEDLFAGMPADDVATQPGLPPQLVAPEPATKAPAAPPAGASVAGVEPAALPKAPEVPQASGAPTIPKAPEVPKQSGVPKAPEIPKQPYVKFLPVPVPQVPKPASAVPIVTASLGPPVADLFQPLARPPPAPSSDRDRARAQLGASSKAVAKPSGSAGHPTPIGHLQKKPRNPLAISVEDLFVPIDLSKYRGVPPKPVSVESTNLANAVAKFAEFKAPSFVAAKASQ